VGRRPTPPANSPKSLIKTLPALVCTNFTSFWAGKPTRWFSGRLKRRPQNDSDIGKRVRFRVFVRVVQYQNPFCPREKFLRGLGNFLKKVPQASSPLQIKICYPFTARSSAARIRDASFPAAKSTYFPFTETQELTPSA